ncbi:MAG: SLC13 family permease [Bacteroidota bacterium]
MFEFLSPIYPYIAITVVVAIFLAIYMGWLRPVAAFLVGTIFLMVLGIISPEELLGGLSNPSIASIILLILLSTGFRKNFNLEGLFNRLMGTAHTYRQFLLRMMAQVAVLSSFINNTPVTTFMVPFVFDWAKRRNISPSKLLIPLSFATILGGMITIIGTSTTLVLNGFMVDFQLPGLESRYFLLIGGAVTVVGILFLWSVGHKLLPDNKDLKDEFNQNKNEYLAETVIAFGSQLIGKNIQEAGLRNLPGVYLAEILRDGKLISPIPPEEVIQPQDSLIFAGETTKIIELVRTVPGLSLPKVASRLAQEESQTAEIVVASNSSMIGRRVKDTDFRNRYDAAIVAINRGGERLQGKIGEIRLAPGDVLLLLVGNAFQTKIELFRDLIVVSAPENWKRPSIRKTYALAGVAGLAVLLLFFGVFSLFTSLMIIFSVMGLMRMITIQDIKRELDFNLIGVLVLSLALGQAIANTGAADMIANVIINGVAQWGPIALLISVLLLTTLLTSFVTNVAAVSITFPIVFSLCEGQGLEFLPFLLGIAFGASAAFLTPIGYQTNLIVYGPGGYTYRDFLRVGFPMTVLYLLIVVLSIVSLFPSTF